MKLNRIFITLIFFLIPVFVYCQIGGGKITGGVSTMTVSSAGNYELGRQYALTPGYYIGFQYDIVKADHSFRCEAMLEYERIKYKSTNPAMDDAGQAIGNMDVVDRNIDLLVGGLYNFYFGKLGVGMGVQLKWTVFGETLNKDNMFFGTYKVININNRKMDVRIPMELSYHFVEKLSIVLRYERGLLNRLGGGNGIKEFENTFRLGVKIHLNNLLPPSILTQCKLPPLLLRVIRGKL